MRESISGRDTGTGARDLFTVRSIRVDGDRNWLRARLEEITGGNATVQDGRLVLKSPATRASVCGVDQSVMAFLANLDRQVSIANKRLNRRECTIRFLILRDPDYLDPEEPGSDARFDTQWSALIGQCRECRRIPINRCGRAPAHIIDATDIDYLANHFAAAASAKATHDCPSLQSESLSEQVRLRVLAATLVHEIEEAVTAHSLKIGNGKAHGYLVAHGVATKTASDVSGATLSVVEALLRERETVVDMKLRSPEVDIDMDITLDERLRFLDATPRRTTLNSCE